MPAISRPGLDTRRSAAWLGGLAVIACVFVVLGSVGFVEGHGPALATVLGIWLPIPPLVLALSVAVRWDDLPRSALLTYPLILVLALDLTGRFTPMVGAAYSPVFVVLFAYAGLTQRRGMSALLVPPAALGWLAVMPGRLAGQGAVRLGVAAAVWLLVAELLAWRTAEQARVRGQLLDSASRDALTGLANRHGLSALLGAPTDETALIMIDLDHFKTLNDTFGHLEGDRVLVEFAHVLTAVLRKGDTAIRYGGEEFLVLAPLSGAVGAERLLARIRAAWTAARPDVTFSAGVAAWCPQESGEDALRRADAALYRAKAAGRSCWRLAEDSETLPTQRQTDQLKDRLIDR